MSAKELDPVPRYSLGQIGAVFEIELFDVDNQYNPVAPTLHLEPTTKMIFIKPDGTKLEIGATISDLNKLRVETLANRDFLDQRGIWQYTGTSPIQGNHRIATGTTYLTFYVV